MPGDDPEAPWLPLAEAGRRTGKHPDTIRAMIRRGRLTGRKGNAGQWLVQMPADPEDRLNGSGGVPEDHPVVSGADPSIDPEELAMARLELLEARERAARAEGELAAEARRSTDLQATLAAERTRGDRLEAALAEARKGWFERLLEAVRRR